MSRGRQLFFQQGHRECAEVPLVGCPSHGFNLAVGMVLRDDEDLLEKINKPMHKLKKLTLNAKLLKATVYRPKTRNVTRWWCSFEMLKRYTQIFGTLEEIDSPDMFNFLLTTVHTRRVDALMFQLKDLESVSMLFQSDETKLADVHGVDYVIYTYPQAVSKLISNDDIVACATFESAIVKIQLGNFVPMSTEERSKVSRFFVPLTYSNVSNKDCFTFAERALKRQRRSSKSGATAYSDLRFIFDL